MTLTTTACMSLESRGLHHARRAPLAPSDVLLQQHGARLLEAGRRVVQGTDDRLPLWDLESEDADAAAGGALDDPVLADVVVPGKAVKPAVTEWLPRKSVAAAPACSASRTARSCTRPPAGASRSDECAENRERD